MKFIITIALELPAPTGDKAIERVNEFFSCVLIAGKPVNFGVTDIKLVNPEVSQEE